MKRNLLTTLLLLTSFSVMGQGKKDTTQVFHSLNNSDFRGQIPNTNSTCNKCWPTIHQTQPDLLPTNRIDFLGNKLKLHFEYFQTGYNNSVDSIKIYVHRSQLVWINDSTAVVKPRKK